MSWYDEHGIHYTEQRFRPVSRFYGDAGAYTDAGARENREPKDPPRSAERIDWWDQLERLVGDRLSDDQRALAEYLKAAGHTLRQTHSLLVTSQMDQLVYRMWDGIPPWVFCRVLGMSKSGMQVILVKSIVLVDPRDVMTLRQMVEEGEHLKHAARVPQGLRAIPAPPLEAGAPANPLDHPVHRDRHRMTWAYCSVAPGTRTGMLLVRYLPRGQQFETAARNVTTLRAIVNAGDRYSFDPSARRRR